MPRPTGRGGRIAVQERHAVSPLRTMGLCCLATVTRAVGRPLRKQRLNSHYSHGKCCGLGLTRHAIRTIARNTAVGSLSASCQVQSREQDWTLDVNGFSSRSRRRLRSTNDGCMDCGRASAARPQRRPASPARNSKAGKKNQRAATATDPASRASGHPRTLRSTTAAAMPALSKMDLQRAAA